MSYSSLSLLPLAFPTLASGESVQPKFSDEQFMSGQRYEVVSNMNSSGGIISQFKSSSDTFYRSDSQGKIITREEIERQQRYDKIKASFLRNKGDFANKDMLYFSRLASVMQYVPFIDAVSSFDGYDNTLYSRYKLPGNLTLSVSQFLDESVDAPVVFSIHRNKALLVSSEMDLHELMQKMLGVIEREKNE